LTGEGDDPKREDQRGQRPAKHKREEPEKGKKNGDKKRETAETKNRAEQRKERNGKGIDEERGRTEEPYQERKE